MGNLVEKANPRRSIAARCVRQLYKGTKWIDARLKSLSNLRAGLL